MIIFWSLIRTFIFSIIPPLLAYLFKLFGIVTLSYLGIDLLIDKFSVMIFTHFSGLPSHALMLLGLAKVDVAVNMILSSCVASFALKKLMSSDIAWKKSKWSPL